jgi:hypothetical protein
MSNKETAGPTSPAFLFLDESPVPIPQPSETLSFRPQQTTAKAVVCEVEEPAVKCLRRFSCVNVPTQAKIGLEWATDHNKITWRYSRFSKYFANYAKDGAFHLWAMPATPALPQKKGALSAKPEYNSGDCAFVFAITTPTISGKATITDQLRFVEKLRYIRSKPDQSWVV